MKGVRNPYAKVLKKQITIRLNANTIDYFKKMAEEMGIPYQVLIDSYLTECAMARRKLVIRWQ
jgi:predicted DNA binding CopG/RHH family protein